MSGSIQDLLRSKMIPGVVTLFGEESFLIYETYSLLVKKFQETYHSGQIEIYDVEEIRTKKEFIEVLEKISAPSFFSSERLFVLKNIEKVFEKKTKKEKLDEHEFLLKNLIENPLENIFLIVITFDESLNGITKKLQKDKTAVNSLKFPFNLLLNNHYWIEFPKMYEHQIKNWLLKRIRDKGFTIDTDALDFFIENVSLNLWEINNELEKICTFLGEQKQIKLNTLKYILSGSNDTNIFELTNLLAKRKFSESISFVEKVLSTSKQELLLLNLINKFFRNLLILSEVCKTTKDRNSLAKAIGVSPYYFDEYELGLKNYTKNEIINALREIANVDLLIKSSSVDTKFLFFRLLKQILGNDALAKVV